MNKETLSLLAMIIAFLSSTDALMECDETNQIRSPSSTANKTFSSNKHGTYMIQSLMSVTGGEPCDTVTIGGLIRVHAVKYAIESRRVAQNISIGYQIDDTCLNLPVTMKRAIDIVNEHQKRTCLASADGGSCPANINKQTSASTNNFIAVIGAYFSFTTIPLSSLLSAFRIPQLSYGASSPLLSKRTEYTSTFRSIPSDEKAVEAMIDVIKSSGWNYIFAVGSDDEYGKIGLRLLKQQASKLGICFTGEMYIPFESTQTRTIAKEIALSMKKEQNATVVVMFNYALEMGEYILEEADKLDLKRIWLTSEAWNPEVLSSTRIPKRQLESILTISLDYGQADEEFLDYINKTIHTKYSCDIWLQQYIVQRYGCIVATRTKEQLIGTNDIDGGNCSININELLESILRENPNQINNLIDIVDSVVNAIDSTITEKCPPSLRTACQHVLQPEQITEALKRTNFTTRQNRLFAYDENGNPAYASYSLEQVQYDAVVDNYVYKAFGKWQSKETPKLTINKRAIKNPVWSNGSLPGSSCSTDCLPGQYVAARQRCCWTCLQCPPGEFSNTANAKSCNRCPEGYHTRDNVGCEKTPIKHVSMAEPIGIATSTLSIIGVLMTFMCLFMIYFLKDTSAIKGLSSRFIVSATILLLLTFTYTALHLIVPSTSLCRVRNIYFPLVVTSFSLLLLLKNSSVTRFVAKSVNGKKNSSIGELLLSAVIVLVEVGLLIAWQCEDNFPVMLVYSDYEYFEDCEVKFTLLRTLSLIWPFVVIVIASVQSLSERRNKLQFGEFKFLHYTCLAFCIISIAHAITLNQVTGIYKVMVTLISTISYGYIFMGCMIATKIFHGITEKPAPNGRLDNGVCNIGFQGENPSLSP